MSVDPRMVLERPEYVDLNPRGDGPPPDQGYDVVEPKMDGLWGQLVVANGRAQVWSRHGQMKHEQEVDRDLPDMVVHGEYLYGSNWALRRGLEGQFFAFDLVARDGRSLVGMTLRERRRRLVRTLDLHGPRLPSWMRLVPQDPVGAWRRQWDVLVEGLGYEGLVFKRSEGAFGDTWARMKRVFAVDYVCTGVNPGGGRYEGRAAASLQGGLWVEGKGAVTVANVGGLDDGLRTDAWEHPDRYVGRVFEATGKGLFDSGGLRHPAFSRWRDDKLPQECVMPQVIR